MSKIARKHPGIQLQIQSDATSDIIRNFESGHVGIIVIQRQRPIEPSNDFTPGGILVLAPAVDPGLAENAVVQCIEQCGWVMRDRWHSCLGLRVAGYFG